MQFGPKLFAKKQAAAQAGEGDMPTNRAQALHVLGLTDAASEAEIIQTHRRLIQKCHPDKGGSEYLARQLNKAKDILIS